MNFDDEIIDWSLKMVRENRVDFDNWVFNYNGLDLAFARWFRYVLLNYDVGEYAFDMMGEHVAFLGGGLAPATRGNYVDIVRPFFEWSQRRNKRNRCNFVMYGLLLYAIRRTGLKYQPSANDDDNASPKAKILCYLMNGLDEVLIALVHGGDFPTYENGDLIDYTDKPLEFAIEAVKASVQES